MLQVLSITNVVLVDQLDIDFKSGLCVLTGETGAGKSILLDSLGLALGLRADQRLIRPGASDAIVTAVFDLPQQSRVIKLLRDNDIVFNDDYLYMRRILKNDGKSKAYINDQPVSIGLLRQIGENLVEFHGQFENRCLLDQRNHRQYLDSHGNCEDHLADVNHAFTMWQGSKIKLAEARQEAEKLQDEENFFEYAFKELSDFNPLRGEETELSDVRRFMVQGEKLLQFLNKTKNNLSGDNGIEPAISSLLRDLDNNLAESHVKFREIISAISQALDQIAQASCIIDEIHSELDLNPKKLEIVEERLFTLRKLSRKHNVESDELPELKAQFEKKLEFLKNKIEVVESLQNDVDVTRIEYLEKAEALSNVRKITAKRLETEIIHELEPLRLKEAQVSVQVEELKEIAWGKNGLEKITFLASTNPGSELAPLGNVASGGELARFMLALKVVLAESDPVPILVFDEVDAGIGGAASDAVGERLHKLADNVQVLVVTHSPQVAAKGTHHLRVSKNINGDSVMTSILPLDKSARIEEIARMLSGAEVTDEARAAADRLLSGQNNAA